MWYIIIIYILIYLLIRSFIIRRVKRRNEEQGLANKE
jgi:hypothetical protein